MNNGKRGLDQVTLFDITAFDQEITHQSQKLKLMAIERGVLGDELIDRL